MLECVIILQSHFLFKRLHFIHYHRELVKKVSSNTKHTQTLVMGLDPQVLTKPNRLIKIDFTIRNGICNQEGHPRIRSAACSVTKLRKPSSYYYFTGTVAQQLMVSSARQLVKPGLGQERMPANQSHNHWHPWPRDLTSYLDG